MAGGMSKIAHVVVLMLENRSFDNLLGWLYGPGKSPSQLIGAKAGDRSFFGLTAGSYWNPSNASFFSGAAPAKVFASEGTTGASPYTVPDTDPEEDFDDINFQIFGTATPVANQEAAMLGFLVNYAKTKSTNPSTLMETYSPGQLTMLSGLAANFAVSDAWFASAPCQTWPNRAFVHLGTSCGRVNNWPDDPFDFNVPTIFNVLEANNNTWAVYNPGSVISLTRLQLPMLWDSSLDSHFLGIDDFFTQAQAGTLPSYSFLEPSFMGIEGTPDDEHPPHDVCLGEQFLQSIYSAVVNGKNWENTLLVVTYDEHGGCPDHMPPPWGAVAPDSQSDPGEEGFRFDRFGVRVPTVLVSPWIQSGTVFRSTTNVPYDHASILATLRDWLSISESLMLKSQRIVAAPTFDDVLNLPQARQDKPVITANCSPLAAHLQIALPPNDLQLSMVAAMVRKMVTHPVDMSLIRKVLATIKTRNDAAQFVTEEARPAAGH
jgi:phospholipase C